jgi:hypothetical protein
MTNPAERLRVERDRLATWIVLTLMTGEPVYTEAEAFDLVRSVLERGFSPSREIEAFLEEHDRRDRPDA